MIHVGMAVRIKPGVPQYGGLHGTVVRYETKVHVQVKNMGILALLPDQLEVFPAAGLGARNELRIYGYPCELIIVRDDRTPRERLSITHALRFDSDTGRVELDVDAVRSKLDEFMVKPSGEPAVNPAEVSVFERMFVERRSKRAA